MDGRTSRVSYRRQSLKECHVQWGDSLYEKHTISMDNLHMKGEPKSQSSPPLPHRRLRMRRIGPKVKYTLCHCSDVIGAKSCIIWLERAQRYCFRSHRLSTNDGGTNRLGWPEDPQALGNLIDRSAIVTFEDERELTHAEERRDTRPLHFEDIIIRSDGEIVA